MTEFLVDLPISETISRIRTEMGNRVASKDWLFVHEQNDESCLLLLYQANWQVQDLSPDSLDEWSHSSAWLQVSVQFEIRTAPGKRSLVRLTADPSASSKFLWEAWAICEQFKSQISRMLFVSSFAPANGVEVSL